MRKVDIAKARKPRKGTTRGRRRGRRKRTMVSIEIRTNMRVLDGWSLLKRLENFKCGGEG